MDSPASSAQQFCLRWHNHQTSLLSSLPLLLDQSHLTDVTLSSEGRSVRAHRVVLSACSSFFSELFRTLEPPFHPVIVLPGTSFGSLVALLTFMYSGEVNVYEEQISSLLALAETLGIKGLADFNGNVTKSSPKSDTSSTKDTEISSPITKNIPSPLESFFNKPFQFYPQIMPQPLNFSQSGTKRNEDPFGTGRFTNQNKTTDRSDSLLADEINRRSNDNKKSKLSDMRKIDKIAENLRCATTSKQYLDQQQKNALIRPQSPPTSLILKPPPLPPVPHHFLHDDSIMPKQDNLFMDMHHQGAQSFLSVDKTSAESIATTPKSANSKLYATCFICHKQLSNQYNLRVHLETHQNVRYACTVCSHVSRSKDALRKHVSYRHPGTPSPCESETRRKRSKNNNIQIKQEPQQNEPSTSAMQQQIPSSPQISPSTPTSSPMNVSNYLKDSSNLDPV